MNPLKCAFGVTAGRFLGFMVHKKGIDVDPAKIKAIQSMPSSVNQKQLKSLLRKVYYIRRFIPALGEIIVPFQALLKKGVPFIWGEPQQQAFEKIKKILTSPATMIMPIKGKLMMLYLTSTPYSYGALLVQEMDGEEKPVYYLSRCLHESELNYPPMEKYCLALVYATQKLRHYFLAHKLIIVTTSDPIKFLLSKPILSEKVVKWFLLLGEFDVSVVQPKAIKSHALSDLLAHFSSHFEEVIPDAISAEFHEEVCAVNIKEGEWSLYFDGSSNSFGGGAGIVLIPSGREDNSAVQSSELVVSHLSRGHISLEGKGLRVLETPSEYANFLISCLELNSFESSREPISLAFKLDFPCTNNQAEYEALVLRLYATVTIGISNLCIHGDSNLIIKQTNGEFSLKEPILASYRTLVQSLLEKFQTVRCEHTPRTTNRYADALAILAFKIHILEKKRSIPIAVLKRTISCPSSELLRPPIYEEEDWRKPIIEELLNPGSTAIPRLKHYILIHGTLYHKGSNGVLARCISEKKVKERLRIAHEQWCGEKRPSLHCLLQRAGYF
ncbi:PREDICTED: uncharacterized protein LOC108661602 [Theobroma cacao]|uniref:Uncharacterized protein LOC108661602 n=1 Tax=Theobroma cacao TaxID=3641 RepID=A0AB32W671_THECC|nr:PREDICTED: uncharacterized protein LOC108661602 [Theobroma cacao]